MSRSLLFIACLCLIVGRTGTLRAQPLNYDLLAGPERSSEESHIGFIGKDATGIFIYSVTYPKKTGTANTNVLMPAKRPSTSSG